MTKHIPQYAKTTDPEVIATVEDYVLGVRKLAPRAKEATS